MPEHRSVYHVLRRNGVRYGETYLCFRGQVMTVVCEKDRPNLMLYSAIIMIQTRNNPIQRMITIAHLPLMRIQSLQALVTSAHNEICSDMLTTIAFAPKIYSMVRMTTVHSNVSLTLQRCTRRHLTADARSVRRFSGI